MTTLRTILDNPNKAYTKLIKTQGQDNIFCAYKDQYIKNIDNPSIEDYKDATQSALQKMNARRLI